MARGRKNKDLSSREMRVISNVYDHFKSESDTQALSGVPLHSRTHYLKKTAELCCVHPSTVTRIVKLRASDPSFASAGSKRAKTRLNGLLWRKNMSFLRHDIRIRMSQEYEDKRFPTIHSLMKFIFELYPDVPRISKKTFRLWMKRWGFRYKKSDNFHFYMEKPDVMQDCASFLADYEKYTEMGYTPVHGDESWVPANHTVPKTWQWKDYDTSGKFCGFRGTMKIKSGAGERLIINHFISEDGFIPNALDLFVGKTGSGDYHHEMNGDHYEDYVRTKLAPNLPDKTLLVFDKASYHSVVTEDSRYPVSNWIKKDIVDWCVQKGLIQPGEQWTKQKLLDEVVKKNIPEKKYVVDEILKDIPDGSGGKKDIKVLRLPTKHCFFNPIELVWAYVKGYVARKNHSCKLKETESLTREALEQIPSDYIARCYKHVNGIMKSFKESGRYIRREVDPLIISDAFDSEDSDDSSVSDDHSETDEHRHGLEDEELDLDTDEEVALEEENDEQLDEEVSTINAIIDETARDQRTRLPPGNHCSCKTGCTRNTCSCNRSGSKCTPLCTCSDDCVNRRQLLPGFSMRRSLIGPVNRPATPVQVPANPPKAKKRRKTYSGYCRCTIRGSCTGGFCVCYNERNICNSNCKCSPYCQNTDPKRLAQLPPKDLFRLSPNQPSGQQNPGPSSVFDFDG